jgi:hypothetical protein
MQGALGYSWPHGPCNKHFMIVSKKGAFLEKEALPTPSNLCFWLWKLSAMCEVTFHPSTPGSTRWLCRSTFATNEGKNASIILNARLRL